MKTQKRKKFRMKKSPSVMMLLILLFMFVSMPVQAVIITQSFTGFWAQPDHESQGFDFQVINQNDGVTQAIVYWYTFDTVGNPMWLAGIGDVVGGEVSLDLLTVTGVTNLQENDPATRNEVVLATATFSFGDCQSGTVEISPKPSTSTSNNPNSISGTGGIFRIQRLTSVQGSSCSGGISDDSTPGGSSYEIEQFMINTGIYPNGNARAKFKQDTSSSEFEVEIEGIPLGMYDLSVDGEIRGQIEVMNDGNETEGEIEFESPADEDELLLVFDPQGKTIEVLEGNIVLFEMVFAPADPGTTNPVDNGAPPFANDLETEVDLNNTGLITSARGSVKLEQDLTEVEFEVEIEDLPLGNYGLYIDGEIVGTISVTNGEGGPEGELEFSFPADANDLVLDFDPRGKLIEIRQGDVGVVLDVNF
ncbi:MAG: hypothetical protein L3J22_05580 [Xanthomonadales bacterium]|nr:hypothetical protein [Xanthomonadales bacterium]